VRYVRLGEKHGIPTPLNSTLLEVVERLAGEGRPPDRQARDPDQLTRVGRGEMSVTVRHRRRSSVAITSGNTAFNQRRER
jgi:hypothetical protein